MMTPENTKMTSIVMVVNDAARIVFWSLMFIQHLQKNQTINLDTERRDVPLDDQYSFHFSVRKDCLFGQRRINKMIDQL